DSVIVEEPIQIEMLRNRPQHLAAILEDGYHRHYKPEESQALMDTMQHAIDLGANYWSLWTEADNLARYSVPLARVRAQLGYRVRPSWIWQRKRYGGVGAHSRSEERWHCWRPWHPAHPCRERGRPREAERVARPRPSTRRNGAPVRVHSAQRLGWTA